MQILNSGIITIPTVKRIKNYNIHNKEIEDITTQVHTEIYTDATSYETLEKKTSPIDSYSINGKKYDYSVSELEEEIIELKDYSYAVVYTIAREILEIGNVGGWFDVIEDITSYIKDPKDKKAIKEIKRIIKMNQQRSNAMNCSSLMDYVFSSQIQACPLYDNDSNVHKLIRK